MLQSIFGSRVGKQKLIQVRDGYRAMLSVVLTMANRQILVVAVDLL